MLRVRVFGLHVSLALYPEADLSVSDELPVPQEEHAVLHDEAPDGDTHTHTGEASAVTARRLCRDALSAYLSPLVSSSMLR